MTPLPDELTYTVSCCETIPLRRKIARDGQVPTQRSCRSSRGAFPPGSGRRVRAPIGSDPWRRAPRPARRVAPQPRAHRRCGARNRRHGRPRRPFDPQARPRAGVRGDERLSPLSQQATSARRARRRGDRKRPAAAVRPARARSPAPSGLRVSGHGAPVSATLPVDRRAPPQHSGRRAPDRARAANHRGNRARRGDRPRDTFALSAITSPARHWTRPRAMRAARPPRYRRPTNSSRANARISRRRRRTRSRNIGTARSRWGWTRCSGASRRPRSATLPTPRRCRSPSSTRSADVGRRVSARRHRRSATGSAGTGAA